MHIESVRRLTDLFVCLMTPICAAVLCGAGGHLLEDEPLLLLRWRLAGALLAALGGALAEGGALAQGGATTPSEKGVLQLLFDLRFLLDLLSGGRPVSTG